MPDNLRILLVEDDLDLLSMVERYLKQWKFAVDPFNDPVEALAQFEKNADAYSLVITDIKMPNMSGIQMAGRMLLIKPDTKVVLMTAYDVIPDDLESSVPVVKYRDILRKPFRLLEICNAVKKQLQAAP
jgi:CheY-like chemotaxis protein